MSETVSVLSITGTIKKGDRKGQVWEGVKLKIGDFQKVIFVDPQGPIKTNFEMKYIQNVLKEEGLTEGNN